MPLFGRGRRGAGGGNRTPRDPRDARPWRDSRTLDRRDLDLLNALIASGADLGKPRHVLHYSYYPSREAAEAAAADVAAAGWEAQAQDPLPARAASAGWPMVAERAGVVLDGDVVRESRDLFEAAAARHGGTYDGWEASL